MSFIALEAGAGDECVVDVDEPAVFKVADIDGIAIHDGRRCGSVLRWPAAR
jgi:hypothetical protein